MAASRLNGSALACRIALLVFGAAACTDEATRGPVSGQDSRATAPEIEVDDGGEPEASARTEIVEADPLGADPLHLTPVGDGEQPDSGPPEMACPEGWGDVLPGVPEEIFIDDTFEDAFAECRTKARFAVVPEGMELELIVGDLPAGALVEVGDLRGGPPLALGHATEGVATVTWTAAASGEVRVIVRRPNGRDTSRFGGTLSCLDGCERETTRYPIVLVHGMAGTDSYFGLLDYYFGVVDMLEEKGYRVYTPVAQFIGHSEVRAPMVAEQLDAILEETGAAKVHLIGHSQGGLDMRILVSGLGYYDRVASMTTIATPHLGLRIEIPEFLTGMDFFEGYMTGEFAETYPDVETIPRFSWAGVTCSRFDQPCRDANDDEQVELVLGATYHLLKNLYGDDAYRGQNDGLVPVTSAIWGELLGIVPADHFDEIGQLADRANPAFDHLEFYLNEARRLRALELGR